MLKVKFIYFILAILTISLVSNAQNTSQIGNRILADKIIGVVGDKLLLQSDITNQILDIKRQGVELPADAECVLIDRIVKQKILVLQALFDSLPVSDDDIQNDIDNRIRSFIQTYGSEEELVRISGKSIFQIKEDFREPIRERRLSEAMERKILENVRITPNEVKAYYEKIPKDSLAFYESMIEVSELSIFPTMNVDAEAYLTEKLNTMKAQIEEGRKSFAVLAKLESDDPGTKDQGGEFTINRATDKQSIDPAFFKASFELKEGEVSKVIKSKFGLHIIQMVSRRGDIAVVRHILKTPQFVEDDFILTTNKLDSIKNLIQSNRLKFGKAVEMFSNDPDSKFTAGKKFGRNDRGELDSKMPIDKFDKDLIPVLKDLTIGQISKPVKFTDQMGKIGFRVVLLEGITAPHRENLKDDYSIIAKRALEEKKALKMEEWFVKNMSRFYVKINESYSNCKYFNSYNSSEK
jgi:peptidyl-prolyl cis-trans isomerase SurA